MSVHPMQSIVLTGIDGKPLGFKLITPQDRVLGNVIAIKNSNAMDEHWHDEFETLRTFAKVDDSTYEEFVYPDYIGQPPCRIVREDA